MGSDPIAIAGQSKCSGGQHSSYPPPGRGRRVVCANSSNVSGGISALNRERLIEQDQRWINGNRPLERTPAKIAVFLNKNVVLRLGLNSHINSQNSEYGRDT